MDHSPEDAIRRINLDCFQRAWLREALDRIGQMIEDGSCEIGDLISTELAADWPSRNLEPLQQANISLLVGQLNLMDLDAMVQVLRSM